MGNAKYFQMWLNLGPQVQRVPRQPHSLFVVAGFRGNHRTYRGSACFGSLLSVPSRIAKLFTSLCIESNGILFETNISRPPFNMRVCTTVRAHTGGN